jgi:hypothetical protein
MVIPEFPAMVSDALGGGRAGIWYVSFNISGPACSKIRIFRTYHGYMLRKADFFNIFILAKFRDFRTCHRNSFAKADRSRFLQALDEALVRLG